ncbi:hypothetical protein BigBertha_289 [Bacillus phage BigBertha]|uniref:Uncharacterized protein n=5 Tax=Caudoviricetes TaxID=2731619 RepID=U5PW25_9CAUD|nr:hypothetical protein TROLL_3 [Bacillus phage Troll]YP_008771029.1 hypothetical protein BigBertha_2 [Bacillus phage BigBertha]YP_008771316.1 hypothetical protein BigBertha_289 [Bacillus phage BigBertha]YP_009206358.1 hypothetical protein AVV02_gp003 [Bacillus phage AvesoBmore]YP_009206654.1 hypothetical protein AVV02_gp299 [Bacillus phage AvesoBmore]AMW61563.1 hypothetical protein JUGLONE_291 [Bacillus phage Juglone]AGT13445.1 hypothetical protein TROLL_3 [Bacillus phage Troll]AGY46510.1 h
MEKLIRERAEALLNSKGANMGNNELLAYCKSFSRAHDWDLDLTIDIMFKVFR